jgi:hypothetical protein
MRIANLTTLSRAPWPGQRLRVDHAALVGLDTGLDPGERVVLRVQDEHVLAAVVRVDFGVDETTYDLQVVHEVAREELAALGATEPRHRVWEAEDVMSVLCRLKRTEVGCEETCAHCSLNPDTSQGAELARSVRDLE